MSYCVEGKTLSLGRWRNSRSGLRWWLCPSGKVPSVIQNRLKWRILYYTYFITIFFFFFNKRTHLAMGCGDTDGNLEKSFYQNFSRRKLCDERQDDVRGQHPADQREWQGLLLGVLVTAEESSPVRDRGGGVAEDDAHRLGVLTSTSLPSLWGALADTGLRPDVLKERATRISNPSSVRKRMTFLINTRTKLNETHGLSKICITYSSGDHIFQTWN